MHYGARDTFVDLRAELLLAEKETRKILVEIKTFAAESQMNALEDAMGQYLLYRDILEETQAEPTLHLAVPKKAADGIFAEAVGQLAIRKHKLALIVFNPDTEETLEWRP